MSDTNTMTHDDFIGAPADDPKDVMRQAREMIPVGAGGAAPTTFADQVTFARDMAKARYSIPQHLQGNVGDCLAIVDMASRAGLSPYMVAQKTYVQSGRINFESQLYHAFLQASGLLKGDLLVEYKGTGDESVCIITGYLKGDIAPRIYESETLGKMHPGYVTKTVDGAEKKFVKGSPLWDRKPRLQQFYDASRDWVRMYAPRATLGILTPYEQEEYGPEFARDVTPAVGLTQRLQSAPKVQGGYQDGYADSELDQITNGGPTDDEDGQIQEREDVQPAKEAVTHRTARKPAKRTSELPKGRAGKQQGDTVRRPAKQPKAPTSVAEYIAHARSWIRSERDMTTMGLRWRDEKTMRNKCGMTAEDRAPLEQLMQRRLGQAK